jgi:hypothetical protein
MAAKSVTANRLSDGVVVYLTAGGEWSEHVGEAAWREDKEAQQALLAEGQAAAEADVVVDPYLIDVAVGEDGRPRPTRNREVIRSLGPTNRTDLGKQAEVKG